MLESFHLQSCHWFEHGHSEQRKYQWENGKDKWIGYINRYPDLRKNGVTTKEQAIQHYVQYGKNRRDAHLYRYYR